MERNQARRIQVLTWIITAAALLLLAGFLIWKAGGISLFTAAGSGGASDGVDSGAAQIDTDEGYTELSHVVFDADEVQLIDIDTASGRVTVRETSDDEVHVRRLVRTGWAERYADDSSRWRRTAYDNMGINSRLQDGELLIRNDRRGFWILNFIMMGRPDPVTEVLIPDSLTDRDLDLKIDASSGNIAVDAISLDELLIDLSSGDVSLNGTRANSAAFDMSSGSVDADGVDFDRVYHDSSSGSLRLDGDVDELGIDISSGRVIMDLDNAPSTINADISSGSIEINMPVGGASAVNVRVDKTSGSTGGLVADGTGELLGDYRVDISSGSFTINAND